MSKKKRVLIVIILFASILFAASVIVARKDFLEQNSEAVEAFLTANEKAMVYISENHESTVEKMAAHIKMITGQELEEAIIDSALNRVVFDQEVHPVALQEFSNLLTEFGFLEGNASLDGLFR